MDRRDDRRRQDTQCKGPAGERRTPCIALPGTGKDLCHQGTADQAAHMGCVVDPRNGQAHAQGHQRKERRCTEQPAELTPLDMAAFNTWVKTASEVLRRHEQQLHAQLHKSAYVSTDHGRVLVTLDIVPDEFEPNATLSAFDADGGELARVRVSPAFKLNGASALAWVESEFARPSSR